MTQAIAAEQVEQFEQQGYLILKNVIDPRVVAGVRREMESMVHEMAIGLYAMDHVRELYENEPFEKRMIKLFSFAPDLSPTAMRYNLHRRGTYGLFFCPRVLDVVEQILQTPEIRLYPNYTVRPKLPEDAKTLVLWHQDARYTMDYGQSSDRSIAADELRMVNVWSPLVPARPENGCMQFIPRTHKLGIVAHDVRKYYLEIPASVLEPLMKDVVDVICDPGDVVLFSNMLFHCGQPNRTDTIRWSCDWRYQDAAQPTLRAENGHLARSETRADQVVRDAEHWSNLSLT